jgi:hypothetical protein
VWQLRAAVKGARAYENLVDEAEKKAAESEVKGEAEPELDLLTGSPSACLGEESPSTRKDGSFLSGAS